MINSFVHLFIVLFIHKLFHVNIHSFICLFLRFFIVGSRDMSARIYSLNPMENFAPITLSGHRNSVIGCYFIGSSLDVSFSKYLYQHHSQSNTTECNLMKIVTFWEKGVQFWMLFIGFSLHKVCRYSCFVRTVPIWNALIYHSS